MLYYKSFLFSHYFVASHWHLLLNFPHTLAVYGDASLEHLAKACAAWAFLRTFLSKCSYYCFMKGIRDAFLIRGIPGRARASLPSGCQSLSRRGKADCEQFVAIHQGFAFVSFIVALVSDWGRGRLIVDSWFVG